MTSEPSGQTSKSIVDFLVIIPTFRRPDHLRDAIDGVLSQSDTNKKILVVDDSPEGSAESIAARCGPDVLYLKMPKPTGGWPGLVRNYGLERAAEMGIEPSFVHFLDDDDIPAEGIYQSAKQAFSLHPEAGVVFGTLRPFCEFSSNQQTRAQQQEQLLQVVKWHNHMRALSTIYAKIIVFSVPLGQWFFRSQYLYSHELFLCSAAMIRYRDVKELNGFDKATRITEDFEFYTRAISAFGVFFVGRVSALYRTGSVGALWNPLAPEGLAKQEHEAEVARILNDRKTRLRCQLGKLRFFSEKLFFRSILLLLNWTIVRRVAKSATQ